MCVSSVEVLQILTFIAKGTCRLENKRQMVVPVGWRLPGFILTRGAKCSSVVSAFAHGVMGRRIDLHGGPIELFLVSASGPQLV